MAKAEGCAKVVVCDAGPLIHLDELDCLDLLGDFPEVLVPEAVWREVLRHRPSALDKNVAVLVRVASSREQPPPLLRGIFETMSLHRGEQEALVLATKHQDALLLTDDTAARLAAGILGVGVHGTIGILIRAIRRTQRTRGQVLDVLSSIPVKSTLHLKRSFLAKIIDQVQAEA
jgi:predicted nucleic acid-binding protein